MRISVSKSRIWVFESLSIQSNAIFGLREFIQNITIQFTAWGNPNTPIPETFQAIFIFATIIFHPACVSYVSCQWLLVSRRGGIDIGR